MTDFSKILSQAKEMEAKMKESQEKIKNIKVEGTSGANSVKVTLNGDGEMTNIEISSETISEGKEILEDLIEKFQKLKNDVRIITIWAPLPGCLPQKVDFPYIMNKTPFDKTDDLKKQLLAVFETECIGFVTAWEYAERYTKSIGRDNPENDRFLVIIQALTIWINAKNLGVACGEEIPDSIKSYIAILREYFGIEVEHLLK